MPLPLDLAGSPQERVSRQLVAAMIFEGLIDTKAADGEEADRLSWQSPAGRFSCRARRGPFGRPRVEPNSLRIERAEGDSGAPTLGELIGSIRAPGAAKGRLLAELEATVASCRLVEEEGRVREDRRAMTFDTLDCAIDEGHPYHPSFKARIGFTADDQRAFAPEFGATFGLSWVAVPRGAVDSALPIADDRFLGEFLGASEYGRLRSVMPEGDFSALPIHPWQWSRLGAAFEVQGVRFLGTFGDRYRASQSVRTLVNAQRPDAPYVKLPLDMVNTSTVRTLDPPSAIAAPVVSRWLFELIEGDRAFEDRYPLSILQEFAGITARHGGPLEGQLGAIWRENVAGKLASAEGAVPLNALIAVERDGRPFVEPWVRRHGLFRLVDRLIEIVVMPLWHLLAAHGVATECHGQNLILVHADGWPTRLVMRDFHDSLEYVPAYLTGPDPKLAILAADASYADETPNRFFWMDDVEELRGLLMDALFVHTLSDLSLLFEHAYGFPETEFWRRIALLIERYRRDSALDARLDQLGHLESTVATEPLLKRKLGLWRDTRPHHVENPLRPAAGKLHEDDEDDQDRRQVV